MILVSFSMFSESMSSTAIKRKWSGNVTWRKFKMADTDLAANYQVQPRSMPPNICPPFWILVTWPMLMIMIKLPIIPCAEKLELVLSTAPKTWDNTDRDSKSNVGGLWFHVSWSLRSRKHRKQHQKDVAISFLVQLCNLSVYRQILSTIFDFVNVNVWIVSFW